MRQLQEDIQDMVYLHICIQAFNSFLRQRFGTRIVALKTYATLQWRVTTIIENDESESRSESWQAQLGDVAMEITRFAYAECGLEDSEIPDDDFERTTRDLQGAFTHTFGSLANELHARLEERTFAHAAIFRERSPLQISEAQKQWQESRQDGKLWRADVEDVAKRAAHIAVLHWKIWAGLVYLEGGREGEEGGGEEEEEEGEEGEEEEEEEDKVKSESIIQDENRPNGLNQIPFKSRKVIATQPDWTLPIDEMSMVDEGGGDLI
jgi:T-complex protein 11